MELCDRILAGLGLASNGEGKTSNSPPSLKPVFSFWFCNFSRDGSAFGKSKRNTKATLDAVVGRAQLSMRRTSTNTPPSPPPGALLGVMVCATVVQDDPHDPYKMVVIDTVVAG